MHVTEKDMRHGGPYDRGAADSYYRRPFAPHYFVGDTYSSPRVGVADMSAAEVALYAQGFSNNERNGNFKDWGGEVEASPEEESTIETPSR